MKEIKVRLTFTEEILGTTLQKSKKKLHFTVLMKSLTMQERYSRRTKTAS